MEYHELAGLFPMISGREADELASDIAASGQREPIVVFEGKILDGRNRFEACNKAGVVPRFVEYQGDDPLAFVVSLNLKRRHLDEANRELIGAKIATLKQGRPKTGQMAGITQAEAAALMNVSERGVRRATKVQGDGAPALVQAVQDGRVSMSAAADVAELPKAEQAEIVAKGEREILDAAKRIRAGKAEAKKAERVALISEQIERISEGTVRFPDGLFHVISIDPPWPYDDGRSAETYDPHGRRAANPYPEMSLDQIRALSIPAADDCVLWLWTTHKFMRHAFGLIDSWGFEDKAILTWVKDRMGLGSWLRSQSEFCVMAVKGSPVINLTNQTTIIRGPLREHSRKPDEFFDMVDALCVGRKLDFFSRESREGWAQIGNDVEKFA